MIYLRILAFGTGFSIVAGTLSSAIETFVLPRSAPDKLTRLVFRSIRAIFNLFLKRARGYPERDRIMAFYAPSACWRWYLQ